MPAVWGESRRRLDSLTQNSPSRSLRLKLEIDGIPKDLHVEPLSSLLSGLPCGFRLELRELLGQVLQPTAALRFRVC